MGKALWVAAFCCALAMGNTLASGQERAAGEADSESQSLHQVLERRFDLSFENTPLKDVASHLTELTGVTFYLASKKLEEASISQDTPLNSSFKNIRLKAWLALALGELEMTYKVVEDLIVITTPEDAESSLEIRVYDCRDLLTLARDCRPKEVQAVPAIPKEEPAIGSDAATPSNANISAAGGGMGGGAWGYGIPPRAAPQSEESRRLLSAIEDIVEQHSWDRVGGPGTVREFSGLVIVAQTRHVHGQIERLLDMLREAAGLEKADGRVVR